MTLEELYTIIQEKQKSTKDNSYTASLFAQREDRIIQKVGEESIEVVIAAKNSNKELISEVADLLFHLSVLLVAKSVSISDIFAELESRKKGS